MLEKLREGSQGLAAKIIIGAIILSFALFGIGNYLNRSQQPDAAVVNGDEISQQELNQAFQRQRQQMQQQYGKAFEQLAADPQFIVRLKQDALKSLVAQKLLDQQAEKMGIRVGDDALKEAIRNAPYFQVEGKFNNERYLALLQQNGLTPASYRDILRQEMARQQLVSAVQESEFALPNEASALQVLRDQQREVSYVAVPVEKFTGAVAVSDEQLQSFYETNKERYRLPETVTAEYVTLTAAALQSGISVTDADAQKYYDENLSLFTVAEKKRVAQILVNFGDDEAAAQDKAEAVLVKLNDGQEFEQVAKTDSEDLFSAAKGGELANYNPQSVEAAFNEAVNKLEVGQVSPVVKGEKAFHIIKLLAVEPEVVKPFADVKQTIVAQMKNKQANEQYYELSQQLNNLAYEKPTALKEVAEELKLPFATSAAFSRVAAPVALSAGQVLDKLFDPEMIANGENSELIEVAPQSSVVVRVIAHQDAMVQSFADISDKVKEDYIAEQAGHAADAYADELVSKLRDGQDVSAALEAFSLTMSEPKTVGRFARDLDQGLVQELFGMAKPAQGVSVKKSHNGAGEAVVMVLSNVVEADNEKSDNALELSMLARQQAGTAYYSLLEQLKEMASIDYYAVE